jgi:hypothetical protein
MRTGFRDLPSRPTQSIETRADRYSLLNLLLTATHANRSVHIDPVGLSQADGFLQLETRRRIRPSEEDVFSTLNDPKDGQVASLYHLESGPEASLQTVRAPCGYSGIRLTEGPNQGVGTAGTLPATTIERGPADLNLSHCRLNDHEQKKKK